MFIFFYFYLLFIYILNKKIILKFKELFNVDKTQNENSNNKNKFIYSDLYLMSSQLMQGFFNK